MIGDDELYVICSRTVDTEDNRWVFSPMDFPEAFDTTPTYFDHQMYVLALLHTGLKDQLDNPKLQRTSKDFYSFDELVDSLAQGNEYRFDSNICRELYDEIVEKHRAYTPRVMTHNDAKWDNWFGRHDRQVLGDFGSAEPGQEYKDVAKVMLALWLGPEHTSIPEKSWDKQLDNFGESETDHHIHSMYHRFQVVMTAIDNYIKIRSKLDEDFEEDAADFRLNVYERIYTESLRTAYYKSGVIRERMLLAAHEVGCVLMDRKIQESIDSRRGPDQPEDHGC
jgi:hypothetical protein